MRRGSKRRLPGMGMRTVPKPCWRGDGTRVM
jgi:hypothetical protein